ncbi:hypothetical protein [Caenispirillum salinarum]|uniref:hypothetical protein n=1 Tax=Caenispirillum salinarum TaxID=859058 RepID=UPI00385144C3
MPRDRHRPRRMLLVTEGARALSSPDLTLARGVEALGTACTLSDGVEEGGAAAWFRLCRRHDTVVLTHYNETSLFLARQMFLARLAGCVVVRWWVGSDVSTALREPKTAASVRRLDRAVDVNIAVAPHLVDELAQVGVQAVYVPSIADLSALESPMPDRLPRGVLVYLPAARRDFYGRAAVERAAAAHRDLPFIVVGDDAHALAHHPNVESLGWVGDMEALWPRIGAVLRLTEHDGLPRMVLEALARGREAIYAWPLDGCRWVRTDAEVDAALAAFKASTAPNAEGREVARRIAADAALLWLDTVAGARTARRPVDRLAALAGLIRCQRAYKAAARVAPVPS